MTRRGRPSLGTAHVDKLAASDPGRERLRLVLATISGEITVAEASQQLGIGPSRFHALRQELLQAAVSRADGLPSAPMADSEAADVELAKLRHENQELRIALEASRIREEIAVVMPHLLHKDGDADPQKKGGRRRRGKRS